MSKGFPPSGPLRDGSGAVRGVALDRLKTALEEESSDGAALVRNLRHNPICSIVVEETVPCVAVSWQGYATSLQLRFVHEAILPLLVRHRLSKVLGDDTALPVIHADDQFWILDNWLPRAKRAGLMFAANKGPDSHFGKVSVESVQSGLWPLVVVRSFETMPQARSWLREIA